MITKKHNFDNSECSSGYFRDIVNNGCTACPIGTYSDTENAESCTDCSEGMITTQEGSNSASQCLTG